jgi:hypothetical protein
LAGNKHRPKGEGKMTDEPFEVWEHRVDELLNEKLEPIKNELQSLKQAHDKVHKEHADALLNLQRFATGLRVNIDVTEFLHIIATQLGNKSSFKTQLIADASSLKSEIWTSSNPSKLVNAFHEKWAKKLRDLGTDFVSL